MADVATEAKHPGEYILNEINIDQSRKQVVIAVGESLGACTVLGEITNDAASAVAGAGNTGDGVMGAINVGTGALQGDYSLTMIEPGTNAGAFIIEDPNGEKVATGTIGAAFNDGGLSFTLADGATDFIAGDDFVITVAPGSGEYAQLDFAGVDGREVATGILFAAVDASVAAQDAVITSALTVVMDGALTWPDGITNDQKAQAIKQLVEKNITVK